MNKRSSNAFYWLFNTAFYVFIIVAVVIAGIEIFQLAKNDYTTSYSFGAISPREIVTHQVQKFDLVPLRPGILKPLLVTSEWKITFDASEPSIKILMATIASFQIVYVFFILLTLRSFVFSLKNGEAFTLQNITRLQRLGILLLLIEPLSWIGTYFSRSWLADHFQLAFAQVSTSYRIGYSLGAREFVWNWIFAGLLVLTIAEVFKQGLKLKEEADLTV
jgi:hypothetical protein